MQQKVRIENLKDINNVVYLLYSKDFKLLVGILYLIYLNSILQYCILFQPIRACHTNAVGNFLTHVSFMKCHHVYNKYMVFVWNRQDKH